MANTPLPQASEQPGNPRAVLPERTERSAFRDVHLHDFAAHAANRALPARETAPEPAGAVVRPAPAALLRSTPAGDPAPLGQTRKIGRTGWLIAAIAYAFHNGRRDASISPVRPARIVVPSVEELRAYFDAACRGAGIDGTLTAFAEFAVLVIDQIDREITKTIPRAAGRVSSSAVRRSGAPPALPETEPTSFLACTTSDKCTCSRGLGCDCVPEDSDAEATYCQKCGAFLRRQVFP